MFVLNGLSLIRLELKAEPMSCNELFGCCYRDSQQKYLRDQHLIYEDVKYSMPHDLIRYKAELQKVPKQIQDVWYNQFNEHTVHLMPLIRNSFYIKQMPIFEECSPSQSSYEFTEEDKLKENGKVRKHIRDRDPEAGPNVNPLRGMPESDYVSQAKAPLQINENSSRSNLKVIENSSDHHKNDLEPPSEMPDEQYAAPNSADLSKIKKEKAIQHLTPYTNPNANSLAKYENFQSAADSSTNALNPIELQSLSQN